MNRVMGVLVVALLAMAALGHVTAHDDGRPTPPSLLSDTEQHVGVAAGQVTGGMADAAGSAVSGVVGAVAGRPAGLSPVVPIPNPGWVRRIPTPQWPADLAAHMSPSGVTNQCVAGALATWALTHAGDPRWNHPQPLSGNAIDLYGIARRQGFALSGTPAVGSMVVYGGSYGAFGHVATVVAVEGRRYEVVEQNFLDFNPNLERHWQTFDLRSIAWPDPKVTGFIVSPR